MKRLFTAATIVIFAAPGVFAANGRWTGKISDSNCGSSHTAAEHGVKMTDRQCVEACVKMGAKYVFVSGGKVYAITNQDDKALALHAGHTVRLAGDMQGESITVSKITMPTKKARKS
jgi:hypothetical protein